MEVLEKHWWRISRKALVLAEDMSWADCLNTGREFSRHVGTWGEGCEGFRVDWRAKTYQCLGHYLWLMMFTKVSKSYEKLHLFHQSLIDYYTDLFLLLMWKRLCASTFSWKLSTPFPHAFPPPSVDLQACSLLGPTPSGCEAFGLMRGKVHIHVSIRPGFLRFEEFEALTTDDPPWREHGQST